jgi:predicted AlkP superfamily pyrophosphatase or phosphodiesterase
MRKRYKITVVIFILAFGLSGWIYYYIRSENDKKVLELAQLSTAFVQQYGNNYTLNSPIVETRVYTVSWIDGDKIPHAAINVGGLWIIVYSGEKPIPTPTP